MRKYIFLVAFIFGSYAVKAQSKSVFDIARSGTLAEMQTIYKQQPGLIDTVNERGSSPLILACYKSNQEVALFLADKVKDINYNSGMGTALMATVMSGNMPVLKKLISKKADLNAADSQGKTALIYAAFFNKNEIAKELISAGANKTQKDEDARSALDYATSNKNTELIILLDN